VKIHIHVGVHKTATTYIQRRLKLSMKSLNADGIGYLPVWRFRSSFWKEYMTLSPETFRIEDHLKDFFVNKPPSDVRGLIISEENLLGLCGNFVKTGRLFNGVRPRLAHFRKLLAGHEITLFFAVRSYDGFICSAYCEGLRSNRNFVGFDDFHDRINWKLMNWPHLLKRVEDGLQPERTVIWRYEQFRDHSEEILNRLAFGNMLSPDETDGTNPVYMSFSQLAMDTIDCVAKQMGGEIAGQLVRPISDTFVKSEARPSFDPWTDQRKAWLAHRYQEDCGTINSAKWLMPVGFPVLEQEVA
jgi:hypothetical protein